MNLTERHERIITVLKQHKGNLWNTEDCPMSARLISECTSIELYKTVELCDDLVLENIIISVETLTLPMYNIL